MVCDLLAVAPRDGSLFVYKSDRETAGTGFHLFVRWQIYVNLLSYVKTREFEFVSNPVRTWIYFTN